MRVEYLNPFVEGVDNVFQMMLGIKPQRQAVKVSDPNNRNSARITSLIGISGQVSGMVALRFPTETAVKLAGKFLGSEYKDVTDEVLDAIAELSNMVGGQAKSRFEHDPPLRLGLPTVVQGGDYRLKYPTNSVWLEIPYDSEAGAFSMEVTLGSN